MGGSGGGHVNPNDLNMGGNYTGGGFENNSASGFGGGGYQSGSGAFQDDELAETLASPSPSGFQGSGQDFPMDMAGMNMPFSSAGLNQNAMAMTQPHMNGYSSTPDGDPIQSPWNTGFGGSFGQMNNAVRGLQIGSYGASQRMPQAMQRKPSSTRTPLTKNNIMNGMQIGSGDFSQPSPIRTAPNGAGHEKSLSGGQYFQNPTPNSISSFPGSGFSSPVGPAAYRDASHLNDMLIKGGTSMPTKLSTPTTMTSSQEAKRRKRRESHNQVERRRRDNINERIQDLSKLVPTHRLEDEKIKKMIANGTPLSPTLEAITGPATATSSLAGPGARRAAGAAGNAGNITTGLPIEEKDKGPNKGDILNGAVAWTRDLMWLARLLVSHNEDMAEQLGHRPYEVTNEEERMTAELLHALARAEESGEMGLIAYSRANGSGLRVPDFTDYKGEPLDGTSMPSAMAGAGAHMVTSVSPDGDLASEFLDQDAAWGADDMELKEEDEFADQIMDLGRWGGVSMY